MEAIEFVSTAHDGVVDLPREYQGWNGKQVRRAELPNARPYLKPRPSPRAVTASIATPQMSGKVFLDTNVVVYLYSGDEPEKQAAAIALIERNDIR